jgi:signal recognition particle subunit SRP19
MSRKATIVEEFDDDTDLPLPSHSLPNTGTRGPLLQQLYTGDHSDDDTDSDYQRAGPASPSRTSYAPTNVPANLVDSGTYKTFVSLCFASNDC